MKNDILVGTISFNTCGKRLFRPLTACRAEKYHFPNLLGK